GAIRALRRIPWHRIETPLELAGVRVIGRHIATHTELGAGIADEHLALGHARRAGDGIRPLRINGVHRPGLGAILGVDGDQPAIQRADDDLAIPRRDATGVDAAADVDVPLAGHL